MYGRKTRTGLSTVLGNRANGTCASRAGYWKRLVRAAGMFSPSASEKTAGGSEGMWEVW